MLKKICLGLLVLFLIVVTTILLLPFSMFQGHIVKLVNESGVVEVKLGKPVTYRLINAHKLSAKEVYIKTSGYEIFLDEISINVNLDSLLKRDIIIDSLDVKVRNIKEYKVSKKSSKSKVAAKVDSPSQNPLDSIVISNFNLDIEKIEIKKHLIEQISLSSKKVSVSLAPLIIESELEVSVFKEMVKGKISLAKIGRAHV